MSAVVESPDKRAPFEPKVIVFACNWCTYAAADAAGTARLELPPGFTVIRVMCTGRVDPLHLLRALSLGADGVLVSGCHPGDCHYTSGNLHAWRRVTFLRAVLERFGLTERLEMVHISAAEAKRYQAVIGDFVARIRHLGPTPLRPRRAALPADKRAGLRALLSQLVEDLGPPDGDLPADVVTEGFGEPIHDEARCDGCGACARACPTGNIELLDEVAGPSAAPTRRLLFGHAACVTCRSCAEACPANAIEIQPHLALETFLAGDKREVVRHPLALCRACGAPVAARPQIDRLAERLGGAPSDLCDRCRRGAHAAAIHRALAPHRQPQNEEERR